MKKIIIPILTMLLTSCAATNYYQVYKADTENGVVNKNRIVFEDINCIVYYNLWIEGGDMGFSIFNKTENDITIDLTKTFFVLNGVANEYYQNRTFSKSSNLGTTVTSYGNNYYRNNNNAAKVASAVSTTTSTSYHERPQLTIPPKTLINISEYKVTSSRYSNCTLAKYPNRKSIKTLSFNKENSPFIFYNLITYSTLIDTVRLENKFFVSEVTNYPSTEMYITVDTSACGSKLEYPIQMFKNLSPDKFYIRYSVEY